MKRIINFYKRYKEVIYLIIIVLGVLGISFTLLQKNNISYNKNNHDNLISNNNVNNSTDNKIKNITEKINKIEKDIEKTNEKLKTDKDYKNKLLEEYRKNSYTTHKKLTFKSYEELKKWYETHNVITKDDTKNIIKFLNDYLKDSEKNRFSLVLKYYYDPEYAINNNWFLTNGNPNIFYEFLNIKITPGKIETGSDEFYEQRFDIKYTMKVTDFSEPFDYTIDYNCIVYVTKEYSQYYISDIKAMPIYNTYKLVERK